MLLELPSLGVLVQQYDMIIMFLDSTDIFSENVFLDSTDILSENSHMYLQEIKSSWNMVSSHN